MGSVKKPVGRLDVTRSQWSRLKTGIVSCNVSTCLIRHAKHGRDSDVSVDAVVHDFRMIEERNDVFRLEDKKQMQKTESKDERHSSVLFATMLASAYFYDETRNYSNRLHRGKEGWHIPCCRKCMPKKWDPIRHHRRVPPPALSRCCR